MTDVVVAGSGVAGLTAALAAALEGADVVVAESTRWIGGTTALSGGVAWLPGNPLDAPGSAEAARRYLRNLAQGDVDWELLDHFVGEAGATAEWVTTHSDLEWQAIGYPDYHAELDGGTGGGRSIEPRPFTPSKELAQRIRPAANVTAPITYLELVDGLPDREEIARRQAAGVMTLGRALIAALATACERLGVLIATESPVESLRTNDGAVSGAMLGGRHIASRVVLASGGFDRDPALVAAFLGGPMEAPTGAPGARGDGLRMAMAAGAALGNMAEAWWCPAISIPDEEIDGQPMYRLLLSERARPGAIMVDGAGRRFVDEAQNYNDVGRALHAFDAAAAAYQRIPAWLIVDRPYLEEYHFGPLRRGSEPPSWMVAASSPAELATRIGVPGGQLEKTITRFNGSAAAGTDPDFGRGDRVYDRFIGDRSAPHPNLRELVTDCLYAVRVLPGSLGTKGGPRTDTDGRVIGVATGEAIPGLYAAGNVAASALGTAYPGAGGTIGPALVHGKAAGRSAGSDHG